VRISFHSLYNEYIKRHNNKEKPQHFVLLLLLSLSSLLLSYSITQIISCASRLTKIGSLVFYYGYVKLNKKGDFYTRCRNYSTVTLNVSEKMSFFILTFVCVYIYTHTYIYIYIYIYIFLCLYMWHLHE
jgi:hypothetical protein